MANLVIDIKDEYKIKIENENDFKNSIFNEVYTNATKNIEEIINNSNKIDNNYYPFNNIIAFTGERGKGKSSSMISFKKALIENHKNQPDSFFYPFSNIRDKKFTTIDDIDPSLFRGEESLFEIIISKMFSKFQEKLEDKNHSINQESKRLLIKEFQHVYNNLRVLFGGRERVYEKEAIEALSELAYGSNLSKSFEKLVETFLKYIELKEQDFLVIAIDDFDLHSSQSYQMLEDIRQFLIQKNVILLIACKMEQLKESVQDKFKKKNDTKTSDSDQSKNKTNKYIEKLFPVSRQLNMPETYDFCNIQLDIDYNKKSKKGNENFVKIITDEELPIRKHDLQEAILFYIYKKIGLFISKPNERINSIIPDSLRGIHMLTGIISSSPINTLGNFKKYVLDTVKIKLDKKYHNIFIEIDKQSYSTLNLYSIQLLNELITDFNIDSSQNNINDVFQNKIPTISTIGDVYTLVKIFESNLKVLDSEKIIFIDLFKIYFSLRCSELCENDNQNKYLIHGGYLNKHSRILARNSDWVSFDRELLKSFQEENSSFYLFLFFIAFYGKEKGVNDIYKIPYLRKIGEFHNFIFSPFAPLSLCFFPNEIYFNSDISDLNSDLNSDLIKELLIWGEVNNGKKYLLNNLMFFNELMFELSNRTKKLTLQNENDKKSFNYSSYIEQVIFNVAPKVLEDMGEKYDYLNIDKKFNIDDKRNDNKFEILKLRDLVDKNPIYNHWKNFKNKDEFSRKLNKLYNLFEQNSESAKLKLTPDHLRLINDGITKINRGKNKKIVLSNFMTAIKGFKSLAPIFDTAEKARKEMDLSNANIPSVSDDFIDYLKSISKEHGQS